MTDDDHTQRIDRDDIDDAPPDVQRIATTLARLLDEFDADNVTLENDAPEEYRVVLTYKLDGEEYDPCDLHDEWQEWCDHCRGTADGYPGGES